MTPSRPHYTPNIHPRALALDHITSIYTMPRTSLVDPGKAKAAVSILIWAPGVTVRGDAGVQIL